MKVCTRSKCSDEKNKPSHSQGAQIPVEISTESLSSFLCFSSKVVQRTKRCATKESRSIPVENEWAIQEEKQWQTHTTEVDKYIK